MAGEWLRIGKVQKNKSGKGLSIYVETDITLKKGEYLNLQDPRQKLKDSVAAGRLSESKAEEFSAKIPEYVKYEIVRPPVK